VTVNPLMAIVVSLIYCCI